MVNRLAFMMFLLLLAACDRNPRSARELASEDHAAGQQLAGPLTLEGQPFAWETAQPKANATVFVFSRTDCPIANRYAPTIGSLAKQYQAEGVSFYLVYIDSLDDLAALRRHWEEYQFPCPALCDRGHRLATLSGATVTPEAVVFDSERKLVYRGRIDDSFVSWGQARSAPTTHELADAIDAVLTHQPVAVPFSKAIGCYIDDVK